MQTASVLVRAMLTIGAVLEGPEPEFKRVEEIVRRDPCAVLVAIASGDSGCNHLRDKRGWLKVTASMAIEGRDENEELLKPGRRCRSKIEIPTFVNVREEEPLWYLDITVRATGPNRVDVTGLLGGYTPSGIIAKGCPDVSGALLFSAGKWRWRGPPGGCAAGQPD